MFKLYYAAGTCALASHIALEEAGADYTAERLSFKTNQQNSAEYLAINPKGRVPALVTPQGVLTETPALLQFIAQSFPQAGLAPLDDAFALARMNEFNSFMCSTVHIAHAHGPRAYRWADAPEAQEAMKKKVAQNMAECFELIETQLLGTPWVLGERFSTSDLYLFTIAGWLKGDGVDIERFPRVLEHRRRLEAQPQVQKVLAAQKA